MPGVARKLGCRYLSRQMPRKQWLAGLTIAGLALAGCSSKATTSSSPGGSLKKIDPSKTFTYQFVQAAK